MAVLVLSGSAQQPPQQRKGTGTETTETLKTGGADRTYVKYVPQSLGAKRPLLIACHGMNQNTDWMKGYMDLQPIADTAKFVAVFPQGVDNGWDISGKRDINFVLAIIDKMVEQHDVDPERVYLTGFSMGGMFTYHAMNQIPDRIAAFAPISGYTMGGVTANANVRALPIIHTHGTSDNVVAFSNVQNGLNVWINHNHCNPTAEVTKNYRGTPHITRHVWSGGDNDTKVVLMEMADKGHWVANDYNVWTADEIWKFCKNYSIHVEWPIHKDQWTPDQQLTTLEAAKGQPFAILNTTAEMAFFGSGAQALSYDDYQIAFDGANAGFLFQLENSAVTDGYLLRLISVDGEPYSVFGKPGYLNSQSVDGWCSFILGINGDKGQVNGEDIDNGAVWNIQYVEEKGFTLKNVGTGKYLQDATPAKYDTPSYFQFYTLKQKDPATVTSIRSDAPAANMFYDLSGRRVAQPSKGLYVVNGKKFLVR
jgi:poly(3-hydroxybutyrate) depolymerase